MQFRRPPKTAQRAVGSSTIGCLSRYRPRAVIRWTLICLLTLIAQAAFAQQLVNLSIRPSDPRVGEPVHVSFFCPDVGGLDRIDERRTRVRMVNNTVRVEMFTRPDQSFGFCQQFIRLGWLPEGNYRVELWFEGALRGQRDFAVLPTAPIPEGQRGPSHNFTGVYSALGRPGRNATVIQSVFGSTLSIILTGYDEQRRSTNWLLVCERWTRPQRCEGTVFESQGDPYTTTTDATTATLTPVGAGRFEDFSFDRIILGVWMTIGGREYNDAYVPLRY
jgi:hypothetical protein